MTHDEILQKLKDLKKAMNWTNRDIAKRSGVHINSVERLLRGENVSFYMLMDVFHGMGVEVRVV